MKSRCELLFEITNENFYLRWNEKTRRSAFTRQKCKFIHFEETQIAYVAPAINLEKSLVTLQKESNEFFFRFSFDLRIVFWSRSLPNRNISALIACRYFENVSECSNCCKKLFLKLFQCSENIMWVSNFIPFPFRKPFFSKMFFATLANFTNIHTDAETESNAQVSESTSVKS